MLLSWKRGTLLTTSAGRESTCVQSMALPKVTADALRETRASGHAIPVTGSVVSTHHPWLNKLFIFVPSPTPTLPDVGELRM